MMEKKKSSVHWRAKCGAAMLWLAVPCLALLPAELCGQTKAEEYVYHGAGNPYLPLWEHLPDGEPRVFEDPDQPGKYRVYIIGSHDLRLDSYCGADIRMWSAPVEDLSSWRDEGPIFTYSVGGRWDVMYAPDLVEVRRHDGTREYYLYPHSRGWNREAMVAKGSRPDGPFTPVNLTEDGQRTLPGSIMGFDPSVYVESVTDKDDPDYATGFRAYGYWGFQRSLAAQLDPNTMYSVRPGTEVIPYFMPAGTPAGGIRDPEGTAYPCLFEDENPGAFCFFEASSIRKVGNKFVTIYSGYSGKEYGMGISNSTLRYAYADTPLGPWRSGGVLVDSRGPVPNRDGSRIEGSYAGHNTHGSIELINGRWYVFYHRAPRGFGFARQSMVAPLLVECDERPVSQGGKVVLRGFNPYAADSLWTARDSRGHEYRGAEVTSEGFHVFGLPPYRYYSAGIACYLSDLGLQKDAWDVWDDHAPVCGVKGGDIVGYKYFGFGGLETDRLGLKAFEGTAKGNHTVLNLFLTPCTSRAFRIAVWLDGPWEEAPWKGRRIGVLEVPAGAGAQTTRFSVDVSAAVDGLDGKHALFLVAENADGESGGEPLFDLEGLGFSSPEHPIERPVVPQVKISVDGKSVELPHTPVRSTDINGITDYTTYEVVCPLPSAPASLPRVSASADQPDVEVRVTQARPGSPVAVVSFNYKGLVKNYRVVFSNTPGKAEN